jgi:hypothetical protein
LSIIHQTLSLFRKNMTSLLRLVLCALLACSVVSSSFARTRSTAKATPASHEPRISAVSGNTITVTDDKSAKTITVSPLTEITLNGQKATFADLKPGMVVSLTLTGPTQASKIAATSK